MASIKFKITHVKLTIFLLDSTRLDNFINMTNADPPIRTKLFGDFTQGEELHNLKIYLF